jgi:hypothetical protein
MQFFVIEQRYRGQKVFAGERIESGAGITLVLGLGTDDAKMWGDIPDLNGVSLDQARRRLFKAYMTPGTVIYDNTVKSFEDTLHARVYKSRPLASTNRTARLGTRVSLWLSLDAKKKDDMLGLDSAALQAGETEPDDLDSLVDEGL